MNSRISSGEDLREKIDEYLKTTAKPSMRGLERHLGYKVYSSSGTSSSIRIIEKRYAGFGRFRKLLQRKEPPLADELQRKIDETYLAGNKVKLPKK